MVFPCALLDPLGSSEALVLPRVFADGPYLSRSAAHLYRKVIFYSSSHFLKSLKRWNVPLFLWSGYRQAGSSRDDVFDLPPSVDNAFKLPLLDETPFRTPRACISVLVPISRCLEASAWFTACFVKSGKLFLRFSWEIQRSDSSRLRRYSGRIADRTGLTDTFALLFYRHVKTFRRISVW